MLPVAKPLYACDQLGFSVNPKGLVVGITTDLDPGPYAELQVVEGCFYSCDLFREGVRGLVQTLGQRGEVLQAGVGHDALLSAPVRGAEKRWSLEPLPRPSRCSGSAFRPTSVLRPIDTNVDGARSRSAPKQGTSGRARGATVAARVGEHAPLPLPSVLSCITLSYMSAVTIRLDPKLQRELDRLCRRLGRTRSEVVRDALRRQIALLRFDEGRRRLLPYAEAAGYLTDEDVFRDVS